MQKEAPKVLVCDPLPEDALNPLKNRGYEVDLQFSLPQERLPEVIGDYDAVILRSGKKITAEVLANSGRLQVIARAGVGVDNIDVNAATQRGIVVINTPDGNTVSAAELTIGHMIALARNLPQAHSRMKDGGWDRNSFVGTELRGKTLGVIGLGNVGGEVAAIAQGLRMNIVGFDPVVTEAAAAKMGIRHLSLEDVLREADFVTLHVPLLDSTRSLINRERIGLMRPGSRLINVARGELVEIEALIEALNEGRLAGAALDVFAKEPPDVSDPVRSHPKIILTPHLGASTGEAQDKVAQEAALGVIEILERRPFRGAINLPRILPDELRQLASFMDVAEAVAIVAIWISEGQSVKGVKLEYVGEISKLDPRPLRAAVIKGLVSYFSDEPVNLVNYEQVASQRGLHLSEQTQDTNGAYSSLIRICLEHEGGFTAVSGVDAHGVRIVEVDSYPISFDLRQGHNRILLCVNEDIPMMIGTVGTLIGKQNINISHMNVGSSLSNDGTAMMALVVDSDLTADHLASIRDLDGIFSAKFLALNR